MTASTENAAIIPGELTGGLLTEIAHWRQVTAIAFSHDSVFEFKSPFPPGQSESGFYNLQGATPELHGHLNLLSVAHIAFQDTPRRGRAAYAWVFKTETGEIIFNIFLGRDEVGDVF